MVLSIGFGSLPFGCFWGHFLGVNRYHATPFCLFGVFDRVVGSNLSFFCLCCLAILKDEMVLRIISIALVMPTGL